MPKVWKTSTILADDEGKGWVQADLSQAQVNRLIKAYKRAGVSLTAYGSPDQVAAQLKAINAMLDTNENARALREMGKLEVIAI